MPRPPRSPQTMTTAQVFGQPEQLRSLNEATFRALTRSTRLYADGMSAFGGEMLRFMSRRWQQDMEFGRSLTKCDQWDKLTAVQQDWGAMAVEDYLAEAGKLVELASKVTTDGWQSLYDSATSVTTETSAEGRATARH